MSTSTALRRALAVGLAIVLVLSLTACASDEPEGEAMEDETPETTEPSGETTEAEGSSAGGGLCDHPYFPIDEDLVLTYSQSATGLSSEMVVEYEVTGEDTFVVRQTVTGSGESFTAEGEWVCTEEGFVQTSNIGLETSVPGVEFSDLEYSGVTLPPADEFVEGARWQNMYRAAGSATVNELTVDYDVAIIQDSKLVGFEEVTVPAGTFEAARVESIETLSLSASDVAAPDVTTSSIIWYAEGVGIVKIESAEGDDTFVQELVSIG